MNQEILIIIPFHPIKAGFSWEELHERGVKNCPIRSKFFRSIKNAELLLAIFFLKFGNFNIFYNEDFAKESIIWGVDRNRFQLGTCWGPNKSVYQISLKLRTVDWIQKYMNRCQTNRQAYRYKKWRVHHKFLWTLPTFVQNEFLKDLNILIIQYWKFHVSSNLIFESLKAHCSFESIRAIETVKLPSKIERENERLPHYFAKKDLL